MGCGILKSSEDNKGCFYDSVTNIVFFKIMDIEELEEFEKWLEKDARKYTHMELENELNRFYRMKNNI